MTMTLARGLLHGETMSRDSTWSECMQKTMLSYRIMTKRLSVPSSDMVSFYSTACDIFPPGFSGSSIVNTALSLIQYLKGE